VAGQVKFYFDEHVPRAVADGLKRRGVDVLTTQEAGRAGLPDDEQVDFALGQERVIVTMDSDYIALAAKGTRHAGIAYSHSQSLSVGELIQALILIHETLEPDDMRNHIEYL
jgi:predicted nuclease of predicted toxin-antitoxin system